MCDVTYPRWSSYPKNQRPPLWVDQAVQVVSSQEAAISTATAKTGLSSDQVLQHLAPGLVALGYLVETGKSAAQKIRRPVLFGENGVPDVSYEIDAFHDTHGIAVEVEAGRGARGNATYRDIVRTSLILDAANFVLMVPIAYRHNSGEKEVAVRAYDDTRIQLDAIFASSRLRLPFDMVLLIGY